MSVCVDYRKVDKDTVPERYLMPIVDKHYWPTTRKYFSMMDLMKGYHQVKMEDHSKHKVAFTCNLGLFQY